MFKTLPMKRTLLQKKFKLVLVILFLMPLIIHANYKDSFSFQIADTEAPTAPTNAKAYQTFATTCSIQWTSSTDNVGVAYYEIYNGTVLIGTSDQSAPYFKITGLTELTSYTFSVKAKDVAGNVSSSSNLILVTTPDGTKPTTPTNLTASDITATSVNLSWTGSTDNVGVTGYSIYNNTFTLWAKVDGATRTFNATGLKQSTTYNFSIKATDAALNSSLESNIVSVRALDNIPPTTPTNLSSSGTTTTSVNLSWTASSDSEGVTGYDIYQGENLLIGTTANTNYTITGLQANNFYSFSVKARDAAGNISNATIPLVCETLDAIPPTTPASLTASEISDTSVNLSWTASTDNKKVTGYELYVNGNLSTTLNVLEFRITTLAPNTNYTFYVKAKDAAGNSSASSNVVTLKTNPAYCVSKGYSQIFDEYIARVQIGTIDKKSNVSAISYTDATNIATELKKGETYSITVTPKEWISGKTQFGLRYAAWIDYNGDMDFYDSEELIWSQEVTTNSPVRGTFTVPVNAITAKTRIRITVRDAGAAGVPSPCGDYTNTYNYGETEDYTADIINNTVDENAPEAPANLTASGTTWTTTNLSWTAPVNNANITGYEIYKENILIGTSATANFNVTGLLQGYVYLFTVKAKNSNGLLSKSSLPVSVTTPKDTTSPTTPANLRATTITATNITISWDPSTNNGGGISYLIYNDADLIATVKDTKAAIIKLANNVTYNFSVQAADEFGNKSVKAAISVTTLKDTTPPAAPTQLIATETTTTTTNLSWTAATDDEYITYYDIYNGANLLYSVSGEITNYNVTGLKEGTAYSFTVVARDRGLNKTSSSPLSVTTVSIPKYCIPGSTAQNNDNITNVTLGKINNSASSGVYSDFKSTGGFVIPGQENTISVSVSKYYSGSKPSGLAFWIDLNGDSDFDDDGELIFSTIITAETFIAIKKFTIPVTATPGRTKMRISLKENGIPSPCEKFYNGAIQDYILDIKDPIIEFEAPSTPKNLSVSNITKTSAILSWEESTDNIAVTGYDIYQGNTLIGTTNVTNYTLTGLSAETVYSYTIKAKDYAKNISASSDPISLTTANLSIEEHDSKSQRYVIYPNPSHDNLFIKASNDRTAFFKISNIGGQIIKTGNVTEQAIDVSMLPSGIYIIELNDGEKPISSKFIKK